MGYLIELIRREHTGTPKELGRRLGLSERMIYRYLEEVVAQHGQICYCRKKKSYKFRPLT